MPDALFERDGARFVPTELCRGPWSPDAQHGSPPAALMARAAERFEGGEEMAVARLTVELLRPVPLVPLTVAARWARPGRKVQIVEASLRAGDSEVARALGLRLRRVPLALPPGAERGPSPPPGPGRGTETLPPWGDGILRPAFHADAVEHRFVAGGFDRPGPATDWIRLRVPLVAGEPTSPLCRVAAAAARCRASSGTSTTPTAIAARSATRGRGPASASWSRRSTSPRSSSSGSRAASTGSTRRCAASAST